ncbi:MAG: glycoside hydrolase family 26 protein, partial [Pirellulaceae bacterium]
MLTIEPWPKADIQQPLLQAITAGQYDDNLASLAQSLQALQGPVYLSWGHEMDQDLTRRYPWSAASPADFIAAYRYVVDWLRQRVQTEIRWIWTAVLKEGSARYWPGDAYADFVGMPVYSFPEFDHATYGYIRHFRQTYEDKRKIATQFGKPLCITELGVHGSAEFASFWLHQAFLALDDYPELAMVIFFYSRDSAGAWGDRFSV